jgi:hypothetical protein
MNSFDDGSSPTDSYLSLLWMVPAGALLFLLFPIVIQAASHAGNFRFVHAVAVDMFKIMFLLTPAVGVVTILTILVLRIGSLTDVTRSITRRAIVFACLDIVAPVMVIVLGIVLSGFTR